MRREVREKNGQNRSQMSICGFVQMGSVVQFGGKVRNRSNRLPIPCIFTNLSSVRATISLLSVLAWSSMAEGFHVDFHLHLDTETVNHTQPIEPLLVEPALSVRNVLQLMKEQKRGSVLICRDGLLVGIFTERDALRLMAAGSNLDTPVEQIMSSDPESVSESDTVGSAISKMAEGGFRRLPIVDDRKRPVGLLKVSTILHYLVEHFPKFVYNLPPKPHHTTQQREGA